MSNFVNKAARIFLRTINIFTQKQVDKIVGVLPRKSRLIGARFIKRERNLDRGTRNNYKDIEIIYRYDNKDYRTLISAQTNRQQKGDE